VELSPPTVAATPAPLNGKTATAVSAALTGLTADTTYYYRAVAASAAGTVADRRNPPRSFHTPALPLTGLGPHTAVEGSAAFTLTVSGNDFDRTAAVLWNGTPLATHFDSATRLEAWVPANLVSEEGSATVSLREDVGTSGGLPFTITDAALSSLNLLDPAATEGIGFSGVTVATFTDANHGAPISDFTATVTWG